MHKSPSRDWTLEAACRDKDPNLFLPQESITGAYLKPPVEQALEYCHVCPVIAECAAEADENGDIGVWGGRYRRPGDQSRTHRSTVKSRRRHARARARARG